MNGLDVEVTDQGITALDPFIKIYRDNFDKIVDCEHCQSSYMAGVQVHECGKLNKMIK